ncbi:Panacea domain-containing protein [Flavobacterium branchiarum]|uniref:Panacea domain-containing protein n=1 Tax=Flavobacterium branchiarum TaxID=1114870 RepID=A0ABV5FQI2_9FLAO|nr:Panacea domain-containing protein [Flavobacterium branchiarum]MDN3672957.1 Panacea domain-containing protein [Flavobacterium branchiarum]
MKNFNLHREKAVNTLLFVTSNLEKADTHKTYKILYFADQKHLLKYGRPIFGDTYVKMQYGPVPSFVKNVVDEEIEGLEEVVAKYHKYNIQPLIEPNLDYLSESDIECLNESIEENRDLSFVDLTNKSHDDAYNKAYWVINYLDMARAIGADDNVLMFINQQMINDNIELV